MGPAERESKPQPGQTVDRLEVLVPTDPDRAQPHVGDQAVHDASCRTVFAGIEQVGLLATGEERAGKDLPPGRIERTVVGRVRRHRPDDLAGVEWSAAEV